MARRIRADLTLVEADGWWSLSFGRYSLRMRSCRCDLAICTCRRRRAADQWYGTHHQRHCHSGHAEHVAIVLRKAIR
jgi:hypothetical protein